MQLWFEDDGEARSLVTLLIVLSFNLSSSSFFCFLTLTGDSSSLEERGGDSSNRSSIHSGGKESRLFDDLSVIFLIYDGWLQLQG